MRGDKELACLIELQNSIFAINPFNSKSFHDTMDSLTYRHNFLKESLLSSVANLPQKDPKRNFDEAQRQVIFRRDKGVCRVCGKQCNWNDWEADHIVPWSKGGKTEIENGQVLCPSCNSKKSDKTVGV